ncbi:carbamoyl-phosphate synthase large subunit [Paenibacillus durus ATCC 35681]|uniref:Carbamoyl-phosphate synthase large subunit n=2 Tax=Paenibacillus durus TaxID=44251 RepID=A0A0F7FEX2_PAEDU|nr:carbamoyl-phosphate synthase large subunit [Paenibacillus durus ATCC 35681]
MIRNNSEGQPFEFFATHPRKYSLMLQVADHAEMEPIIPLKDYAQYCLNFCSKHKIDVFIPHYRMFEIAKHEHAFKQIGTKLLLSGNASLIQTVSDKGELFRTLSGVENVIVPDHYIVNNAEEFVYAYQSLKAKGHRVCFKPVRGEGGSGFRIIQEQQASLESLYNPVSAAVNLQEVTKLLSSVQNFEPLMVMEYMNGYEYSIDCLADHNYLYAAIPRKKVEGRIRALENNQDLIQLAHSIHKILPLRYNFNIQVIYQDSVPKLLEINPRTSGGLYTSCLSGINFPYLSVKLLQGQVIQIPEPSFDIFATHIEQEVLMTRFC